jgi:hypothetical protein
VLAEKGERLDFISCILRAEITDSFRCCEAHEALALRRARSSILVMQWFIVACVIYHMARGWLASKPAWDTRSMRACARHTVNGSCDQTAKMCRSFQAPTASLRVVASLKVLGSWYSIEMFALGMRTFLLLVSVI